MAWRNFFQDDLPGSAAKESGQSRSVEEAPPKNGRLVMAVGAAILLMAGLGVLNYRLIQDPSIAGKTFRPGGQSGNLPECLGRPLKPLSAGENKSCYSPPEVTFYRELTAQEERASGDESISRRIPENQQDTGAAGATASVKDTRADGSFQRPAKSGGGAHGQGQEHTGQPEAEKTSRHYTVQVGAFTHPGIAQEWATKWKARGYEVALKPVARPRTGVIYRLYLGRFSSEKEAEELVKRLKSKEGISAFWLAVR